MTDTIDWVAVIIGLFGDLAIFLFGMEIMTSGLKNIAGSRMKDLLGIGPQISGKALLLVPSSLPLFNRACTSLPCASPTWLHHIGKFKPASKSQ